VYEAYSENPKEKDHTEDIGVDGRIMLEYILEERDGKLCIGFIWFRMGNSGDLL
jgi:hypothetical protein